MSYEEKVNLAIENIKCDLAIEKMSLSEKDIELIKKLANKEITIDELIFLIKKSILERVK